jgi:hypothetical protein
MSFDGVINDDFQEYQIPHASLVIQNKFENVLKFLVLKDIKQMHDNTE